MNPEQEPHHVTTAARPKHTLADLRRAAGLSQPQMGRKLNKTRAQISRIEAQFPAVNFTIVQAYVQACGGHIVFTEWDLGDIFAEDVQADPERQDAVARRKNDPKRGFRSLTTEELPLEQRTPQTGRDDTGRNIDETDTEGHQGDREDRKET